MDKDILVRLLFLLRIKSDCSLFKMLLKVSLY